MLSMRSSKIMSEEEISYAIKDYILNVPYPYAILIDGEWGCGKTYYVNNSLKKEIETLVYSEKEKVEEKTAYKVVKISLYGVTDVNEISKQMYTSIYTYSIPKTIEKIGKPLVGAALKIVSDVFEKPSIAGLSNESASLFEAFTNLNKYVFIFDDLERCSIPVYEVLGFINNMVETNKVKVIIVACQKEIHSIPNQKNQELKYLLSTIDRISFPDAPKSKALSDDEKHKQMFLEGFSSEEENQQSSENNQLDIDTIKYRSQIMFSENDFYKAIKEKLIGQTFYFRPSLKKALPEIVGNYFKDISTTLWVSDTIENVLIAEDYFNLRTVQAALVLFQKVFSIVEQIDFDDSGVNNIELLTEELKQNIVAGLLKSILFQAVHFAAGNKPLKWEQREEFRDVNWSKKSENSTKYTVYRFVELYFNNGYWNEILTRNVILAHINDTVHNQFMSKDPIRKLSYYYTLSNDELVELMNEFDKRFFGNMYKSGSFLTILKFLLDLEHIGIEKITDFKFDKYFTHMCDYVNSNGMSNESFYSQTKPQFEETYNKHKACVDKLSYIAHNRNTQYISKFKDTVTQTPGWGDAFRKFYDALEEDYTEKKLSFISLIDIDYCLKCFATANVKDIHSFRSILLTNYGRSFNENISDIDREKLKELKSGVESILNSDIQELTKKMDLEFLVSNIERIVNNEI